LEVMGGITPPAEPMAISRLDGGMEGVWKVRGRVSGVEVGGWVGGVVSDLGQEA
jgi:hypothetical protein